MGLTIDNFKSMIVCALERIKVREEEFSKLDAVAGDGDHGTAIVTAMEVIAAEALKGDEFSSMLDNMGTEVMMQTSGSTSTLLGAFFMGMGEGAKGVDLDTNQVKAMFTSGLRGVQEQTKAMPGDKTIMDALVPAIEAITSCQSEDVKELLRLGAEAAEQGAAKTVEMQARFGRAHNLGERSIGAADAGATSWACMFSSFYQGVQ